MWRQLSILPKLWQPAMWTAKPVGNIFRSFSIFSPPAYTNKPMASTVLLQPAPIAMSFDRGMKQMGRLKRRCKDCYFVTRQERLYVMCKTGKHKQMMMMKKPKNTWLLTDATQSKLRAW